MMPILSENNNCRTLASTGSASAFMTAPEPVEGPGFKAPLARFDSSASSPQRRLSKPGSSGVTLVEILVSLTILVLVTSALSSGTNYLTRRLVRAKNAAVA
ncbi:MAG: hypothetical protein PWR01_4736, partial [Clostridiales bacterium]|nr:hypothetical protein [Clostridiales bacterium]MDN5283663.1 hypothetical protein [Candidatus Ozemobacter sp.]